MARKERGFVLSFFFGFRQRRTSDMKLSKYIVLSLLLFMCHRLNCVHCSDAKEANPEIPKIFVEASSVSESEERVEGILPEDGLSKSTCLETDENCDNDKGGETFSISSEYTLNDEILSRPTQLDTDEIKGKAVKDDIESLFSIFSNYDRTTKGYLTKNDVTAFLQYKSGKNSKVSTLETNLFISSIDTDHDGKISLKEYSFATRNIKTLMTKTFDRIRSEEIKCIYEEDLELLSDNVEFDFLLLDSDGDECFSIEEFEDYFHRFGFDTRNRILHDFDYGDKKLNENAEEGNFSQFTDKTESDLDILGEIDLSEITEEPKFSSFEEAIDSLWESIDGNADGYLSLEELEADLEWYGFQEPEKVAEPLFALMDSNMDEMVSRNELKSFFNNPPTKNERIREWMDTFWETNEVDAEETPLKSYDIPQWKWKSSLAFMIFDKNRNGFIEWEELKSAMEAHRKFHSDGLADAVADYIDVDKDGRISLPEFSNAVRSTGPHIEVAYVDEFGNHIETQPADANFTNGMAIAFERIDENGDGFIISKELKYFLELRVDVLTEEDMEEVFAAMDVNKNGFITLSDVHTFLTFTQKTVSDLEEIDFETFKQIVKGAIKETVADEEVNSQFSSLDINSDALISPPEFQILVSIFGMTDESNFITWIEETRFREQYVETDDEFKDAFELFDQDHNHIIDKEELGIALNKLKNDNLQVIQLDEYFIKLDINGDDFISMDEFNLLLWQRKE